jgi:hypothetical protein
MVHSYPSGPRKDIGRSLPVTNHIANHTRCVMGLSWATKYVLARARRLIAPRYIRRAFWLRSASVDDAGALQSFVQSGHRAVLACVRFEASGRIYRSDGPNNQRCAMLL